MTDPITYGKSLIFLLKTITMLKCKYNKLLAMCMIS